MKTPRKVNEQTPTSHTLHQQAQTDSKIHQTLLRWWGYDTFRPLQIEAISAAIYGRDSVVVLPTGGGKSLCYQLPPLLSQTTDIVVSPLVSLMKDQVDALDSIGYPAATIHGGLSPKDRRKTYQKLQNGNLRLLFVAPERLFNSNLVDTLSQLPIQRFAIDEAHCISQWGHDFRPEYRQLSALREHFPQASFHAYTATATPHVRKDIAEQLHLKKPEVLVGTFDRPNLTYRVIQRTDKIAQILEILGRHRKEASIIYCNSRRETERLAKSLTTSGLLAHPYHAGLDAKKRHRTQEAFAKETLDIVIATVAFGMGIDRSNVRLVLHTGLPKSLEAYQQETGRAGRDGLAAECVLLYSPADVFSWEALIRRGAESSELTEDEAQKLISSQIVHLQRMRQYAQAARCRHAFLSEHFGQSYELSNCKNCDICLEETTNLADSTTVAQKILSCVARIKQRFGVRHLCEVLRGAQTDAVQRNRHHNLSTYGLLKNFDQRTCENLVHQLLDQDYLSRSESDRPVVMLNQKSWEILRGQREVTLLEPRLGKAVRSRKESDDWIGVDQQLFEHLRIWRRKIANERGKPAWTILDDRALRSIAREKPDTLTALLQCKGIGEKRLADHGTAILKILKKCEHELA